MIYTTLKELNNKSKGYQTISNGYISYIVNDEVWKHGKYHNIKVEYYVSNYGRVYNIEKNRFEKLQMNDSGYLYCHSYYKGYRTVLLINRLVAETFLGYPYDIKNAEADHIDSNKLDNSLQNIQWLSNIGNLAKRTLSIQKEDINSNAKYTKDIILEIANLLESGLYTVDDISDKLSIPSRTIYDIKYKHRWSNLLSDYKFDKVPEKVAKRKEYTDKDILAVANLLHANNLSIKDISNITGVSYDTVNLIRYKKCYKTLLKDYDFSKYSSGKDVFTKDQKVSIDTLLVEGLSPKEICDKLNIEYTKRTRNSIYDRKRKLK